MRVVLQRVTNASLKIDGKLYSEIGVGYLLLVGFTDGDDLAKVNKLAQKIVNLRVFSDENNKMNLNLAAVGGAILSVSQFTLYADPFSGNRPSFGKAMASGQANKLYDQFNEALKRHGVVVKTGVFGAMMDISFTNNGPVTIIYDL